MKIVLWILGLVVGGVVLWFLVPFLLMVVGWIIVVAAVGFGLWKAIYLAFGPFGGK